MILTIDPVLADAGALAVGGVLAVGGLLKLRDPAEFRAAAEAYRILPAMLLPPFALAFPVLELWAGLMLALPSVVRPLGALLAVAALAVASAGVALNLLRGRDRIDCGCGGSGFLPLSRSLLGRNAVLIALVCVAALPASGRPRGSLDIVAVGFGALFLLGLYAIVNQLLVNRHYQTHRRSFS